MKYKLYQEPSKYLRPTRQILLNRGIDYDDQEAWLNAAETYINHWKMMDYQKIQIAVHRLANAIIGQEHIGIIVDPDCDGYTSAAIFMNYFYRFEKDWAQSHIHYFHHDGKEHGLNDVKDEILNTPAITLLISPDGGSNDCEAQEALNEQGIDIIILDHHDCVKDYSSKHTNIINIQLPFQFNIFQKYCNPSLTGAGVVFKFCQAYNQIIYENENSPDWLYDLCAVGNCGDMADYRQIEIRALMNVGLSNIQNPFLKALVEQNDYSIQKMNGINYYSVAFYVVPFINALTRSGSMAEKDLVFKGLLEQYAYNKVYSSKRGHKGEYVPLYEEALVVVSRVKRRQTKLQNEAMDLIEAKIQEQHLNDNAMLLLCIEQPELISKQLAGLVANKLQAKYQKPAAVLLCSHNADDDEDFYRGSMRNYSLSPVKDLKAELEQTGEIEFCAGR